MFFSGQKLNRWTKATMTAAYNTWKEQQSQKWQDIHPGVKPISIKRAAAVSGGGKDETQINPFFTFFCDSLVMCFFVL
jgi:hypothetical protein